jgi:CBS domain-containing protein
MLTARDIMQTDVVTANTDTTARQLARLLSDEDISGVPVLDEHGELAGVVSSTDLVRLAADEGGVGLRPAAVSVAVVLPDPDTDDEQGDETDPYGFFLPEDSPFLGHRFPEQWPEGDFDEVTVSEIMTPVSFSVTPDTPVKELCEFLVRGRIHRAVVRENGGLLGVVTSSDVLRAVAEGRLGA